MQGKLFILAASALLLSACGESKQSSNGTGELPLECNEVIEKQVTLFKDQNRSEAEIEAARSDLDVGQTVQIVRHLHGNQYEVFYRGAQWQAEAVGSSGTNDAQTAVITGKNGNILLIQIN